MFGDLTCFVNDDHYTRDYTPTMDYELSIADMLDASGFPQEDLFSHLVRSCGGILHRSQLKPFENARADSMERVLAPASLQILREDGGALWMLLSSCGWMSPSRLIPIALRLIQEK